MIIPKMYNIKISCKDENNNASYNIDIDTDVTVTATVLDFNGNPVVGEDLTIYYDDETSIYTGITDSNGQISTTYTCAEWGTHVFSIETYTCFINVTGWRVVHDDGIYYLKYNDKMVFAKINYNTSVNWNTTVSHLGAEWLQDRTREIDLRPPMPVSVTVSPNKTIMLSDIDYRVGWFTNSGTSTGGLYAHFLYGRK